MKTDIEIAREAKLSNIEEIRTPLGIREEEFSPYGRYMGKISLEALDRLMKKEDGKLIVVTAITPTKYGEGKTTTSIGLSMALNKMGKSSIVTLREPSLGPVFGVKGGAAGGGYSQVLPMEDINLHFTGDIHAVTTANNLLSAVIGNYMHYSNAFGLDTREMLWKRAMDMNDRELRNIVVGLGGEDQGYPREDNFIITAASEIMALLTLSRNIGDLKARLCKILIGFTRNRKPVYLGDFNICGAMAAVLKDAVKPNLVQTIENTPALIHSGPFANISVGTNSVTATKMALKLSDYVVIECGFGSDLGLEKFVNVVSRVGNYKIHAVIVVATVRALKHQGGGEDFNALKVGLANLGKHIDNVLGFNLKPVVAVNVIPGDSKKELELIKHFCKEKKVEVELSQAFEKGSDGAVVLAEIAAKTADLSDGAFKHTYELQETIAEKIEKLATRIYGADGVIYSWDAKKKLKLIKKLELDNLPVCIAKTNLSLSDNKNKLNVPTGWRLNINDIEIAGGAGYVIPIAGDIMLMPGLPKEPSAEKIDIDDTGKIITGLF